MAILSRPFRLCDGNYLSAGVASTPEQHAALRAIRYGEIHHPDTCRGIGYRPATIAECYADASENARCMVREAFGTQVFADACDVHYRAPHGTPSGGVYFEARSRADADAVVSEGKRRHGPSYQFWIESAKR